MANLKRGSTTFETSLDLLIDTNCDLHLQNLDQKNYIYRLTYILIDRWFI